VVWSMKVDFLHLICLQKQFRHCRVIALAPTSVFAFLARFEGNCHDSLLCDQLF
jgi:hypothetical protein